MKKATLFFWIILLLILSCENEEFEPEGSFESFTMSSTFVSDSFKIFVYLPSDYALSQTEYPLIIGLDADNEFEPMAEIVEREIMEENIPSSLFIGIGYGSSDDNDQKRNRDYTPSETEGVEDFETGGAENFYNFISQELIPEIESRYQTENGNTKTLMGHSYGGLFTLYAMFQKRSENPFDKFIPVAASFWYDSGVIFEFEEAYAQNHGDLSIKTFTSMGSLEGTVMVASFEEMNERIENRNYPGLKYTSQILKKYGHSRSDYISYENGLQYVFNN